MNNFGVIEVASTRTAHAPGWAYVRDTARQAQQQQQQQLAGGHRKRGARAGPALSASDLSARHDARVQKELEVLDRDGGRDVGVPAPPKGSGRAQGKHTPNVRKILASQKTFANHLDDFEALLAQEAGGATGHPNQYTAAAHRAAAAAGPQASSSRGQSGAATPAAAGGAAGEPEPESGAAHPSAILAPYAGAPPPLPGDDDPLLASWVPPPPADAELRALAAAPPLRYHQARGAWPDGPAPPGEGGDGHPPRRRHFCEVCGYWGRVRCGKCGARVCALDCLEVHRDECVTRYGL